MQSSPQALQLPPAVDEIARAYQMGEARNDYGLSRKATNQTRNSGIACLIIGGLIGFLGTSDLGQSSVAPGVFLLLLAGLVCIIGVVFIVRIAALRKVDVHIYTCENGFIYAVGQTVPQPFRWDQIQAVWRKATNHYRNGVYTGTSTCYTIERKDGSQVVLDNHIDGIEKLGKVISARITRLLLPQVIEAFNSGQTITFALLTLDQQGLNNGHELLPWTQVEAVDVKDGFVSVKRQGAWLNWDRVAAAEIPNFFVFQALVDYVLKQYGKR